jgi:hypothetical protein
MKDDRLVKLAMMGTVEEKCKRGRRPRYGFMIFKSGAIQLFLQGLLE